MERALVLTAAGGLSLYLTYLLIHGEQPRVAQRIISTVPRPKQDNMKEPVTSGSASSIVAAIAQAAQDPHLMDRPVALGGDAANTGTDREHPTAGSLEEERVPGNVLSQEQINGIIQDMDFQSVFNDEIAPVDDSANGADMKTKDDRCSHFAVSINSAKEGMYDGKWMKRQDDPAKRSTEKQFLEMGYDSKQAAFLESEHCGTTF